MMSKQAAQRSEDNSFEREDPNVMREEVRSEDSAGELRQNSQSNGEQDEEEQYSEDIEGIKKYQHKILRKFAMLGMIHYSTVPYFHQLVQNRDYKMICIFEVFAQNRDEDDFLNNLEILDDMRNEDQVTSQDGNL